MTSVYVCLLAYEHCPVKPWLHAPPLASAHPQKREARAEDMLSKHREALSLLLEQRDALRSSLEAIDSMAAEARAAADAKMQAQKQAAEKERSQQVQLAQRLAVMEQKVDELASELAAAQTAAEAAKREASEATAERAAAVSAGDQAMSALESATTQAADLEQTVTALTAELAQAKAEADAALEQLTDAQARAAAATTEAKRTWQQRVTELEQRTATLTADLAASAAEAQRASTALAEAEAALSQYRTESAAASLSAQSAKDQVEKLNAEVERLRSTLSDKENKLADMVDKVTGMMDKQMNREQDIASSTRSLQQRSEDLAAQVATLHHEATSLRGDLRDARSQHDMLQGKFEASQASVAKLEGQLSTAQHDLACVRAELQSARDEAASAATASEAQRQALEDELASAGARADKAEARVAELTKAAAAAKDALAKATAELASAQTQAKEATERAETAEISVARLKNAVGATEESKLEQLCTMTKETESLRRRVTDMDSLRAELARAQSRIAELEDAAYAAASERRVLHNTLQDLRGNIRVMVRVRPFLPGDDEHSAASAEASVVPGVDGSTVTLAARTRGTKGGGREAKPQRFEFDRVFGPDSAQSDVFDEVSTLVQSALDGYAVCIFSYGQTGSGKTHTMAGGEDEQAGIIPRSISQILAATHAQSRTGWEYTLEASYVEIYNETLRDLLAKPSESTGTLSIQMTPEGGTRVVGNRRVVINTDEDVHKVMRQAARARSVATTDMNAQSSRSHAVFTLHLSGHHEAKGANLTGALHLCDLAGSERVARSGVADQRLREAQNINKSLSSLSSVFTALANKASHVPFRDSKLTYLLQPCFRGDGKTLMLVNVSPTAESMGESLCSLRFAHTVAQVQLGKAKAQISAADSGSAASAARAPGAPHAGVRRPRVPGDSDRHGMKKTRA